MKETFSIAHSMFRKDFDFRACPIVFLCLLLSFRVNCHKSETLGGGGGGSLFQDVPLVDFTYLVFTRIPGKSYRRRLGSLIVVLV